MRTLNILLLIIYLSFVRCQSACNNLETCGDCIGYVGERCVWCKQESVEEHRCQPESIENKRWCDANQIENPPSILLTEQNKEFSDKLNETIQFRPQLLRIKARPGVPVYFNMSYKPAKHFPLDVYYLMDNSYTMLLHKEELTRQASEIYTQLTQLTNNVHLGLGSFVEKPGFPYYDKNMQTHSYAFKNLLSLTKDVDKFQKKTQNIEMGANYDDMEAGLDALMQVMACEKEIGWRSDARRIIVLCTDSPYHSAGDGKMIGIIKPNDMKCHLKDHKYELEMEQDYPSVSQINTMVTRGKFTVIFAATSAARDAYTALARHIVGASYAELKPNSNIINIIKEAYLRSVNIVKLDYEQSPFVHLTLDQECEQRSKRNCETSFINPVVTIPATLTVQKCTEQNINMVINPIGLNDKLTIVLQTLCKCPCEATSIISSKCNNVGHMQCGICKCDESFYGDKCQCSATSEHDILKDINKCKKNTDDTNVCSSQGECLCGKCKCNVGFSGNHCEYDNKLCPSPGGKLCSDHGSCYLGSCHCRDEWSGNDCSCSNHKRGCIAPYSDEVCSGNGDCVCGQCKCKEIEGKNETYTGVFCDSCTDCQAKYCKALEKYVVCNYENSKADCDKKFNDTETFDVQIVNKTEMTSGKWSGAAWCKTTLEDNSIIIFIYYYDPITHNLHIVIQKETEAPPIANRWIALFSAIGLIVLIGLLTLIIWKILVDLHDKREYAKFKEESEAQGFDVRRNVLYEDPTTNIRNPVYDANIN